MPETAATAFDPRDPEDIESLVGKMIDDAVEYNESDLAPFREKAIEYYMGRPFGNEEQGRSQYVSTDVRDTIQQRLATLMRLFFSRAERAVEYRARELEDEPAARQATDYITDVVVLQENHGFVTFYNWFKDALRSRVGIVKWWYDESVQVSEERYTALSPSDLEALESDDEVEVKVLREYTDQIQDPAAGQPVEIPLVDAKVKRKKTTGRVRFGTVPPNEVSWNKGARTKQDARIVVHTVEKMLWEIEALGWDREQLLEAVGQSNVRVDSADERARQIPPNADPSNPDQQQDPSTRPIRYDEAYVYLDLGDGTQLYRVCMAGNGHVLLRPNAEKAKEGMENPAPVEERPFSWLVPDPEPHTILGLGDADYTMDLQLMKSAVIRGTLDSLSLALIPRMEAVETQVNLKDLMNTEIGAVVRTRQPGMLREISHRFVGGDSLPFIEYVDSVKENRLGISRGATGLDADHLQSMTKPAAAAVLSAAQQRAELTASIFAHTGVRELMTGLLRLVHRHQDRERVVRLRNEYVKVDPRTWNVDMDVVVNVGLGAGTPEDRMATLEGIISKLETIMQQLGPDNPITGLMEYRDALATAIELGGWPHAERFVRRITPEQAQQLAQAMGEARAEASQAQVDPAAAALAEIEKQRLEIDAARQQAELELKQQELALKAREIELRDDRERDKQAGELAIQIMEIEAKNETSLDRERIAADVAMLRAAVDADTRVEVAAVQARNRPGGGEQ